MNAISKIGFRKMRNEVHAQFHENSNTLIGNLEPTELPFQKLIVAYKQTFDHESEALLIDTKSEKTAEIVEQDRVRDSIFRGFTDTVKGLRNHYDTEIRVGANRLWNSIFLHYGNITTKTYDAETAAINDFLREIKRPEFVVVTNKLKVQDWVAKLEEENNKFHTLMMERYCEVTERTVYRMKTARVETDKFYRAIVSSVEAEVLLGNVTETLTHFITELNAIIHRFKSIMAQEQGKKKGNDEEPTDNG